MTIEPSSNQKPGNSEYTIGQDNIRWLGLDVHNPVFIVSATLVVTFVAITIFFLDSAGAAFSDLRIWITTKFDWVFMISMNFFVLFGLFIAYSKLGRIRLGGTNAKPKYSYPAWLAMLFSAGVGIGLINLVTVPFFADSVGSASGYDSACRGLLYCLPNSPMQTLDAKECGPNAKKPDHPLRHWQVV